MSFKSIVFISTILFVFFILPVNAALYDRGNGLIYDSDQDITWLADANYAYTSGYAAANLVDNGPGSYENISSGGRMGWFAALTWADQLVYGGYDDWRLFNADPTDTNCSDNFDLGDGQPLGYYGFNCSRSELGHLFYVDLGLIQGQSILSSTDPDLFLFSNIRMDHYWSGVGNFPSTDYAWDFNTFNGKQDFNAKGNEFFVWAVRDGDVIPIPAPLALIALGLAGIGFTRFKKT